MKNTSVRYLVAAFVICLIVGFALLPSATAFAQGGPSAETPTGEPPTNTPVPPTAVPPEPSDPMPIPEPVTVVLFGTGLAALSAAVATRRNRGQDGEE